MSGTAQQLSVDSATGIDVTLPIAGIGARSYAFVADWHIRLVLGLAWYGAAALLYNYLRGEGLSVAPPGANEARWFGIVLSPALALYFLYHPVLELAMRGSTPGKRLAGVRAVTRDGAAPGAGALLLRNVFRLIDSLPVAYGLGLVLVALTREHVRCGDMAAGTVLVYERSSLAFAFAPAGAAGAAGAPDLATAELVAELLARWPLLTPPARAALARRLLARCGRAAAELGSLDEAALHRALIEATRAAGAAP
ncbi:MAG TPA: RDD family protein [Steroidobacteraceae bacterium]|nr:RDD family protein [Steroidobacteraceae bacterium]